MKKIEGEWRKVEGRGGRIKNLRVRDFAESKEHGKVRLFISNRLEKKAMNKTIHIANPKRHALSSKDKFIKAGIIGGAGYTGSELMRILINHPHAEIIFVHSRSNAGKQITQVHSDIIGETDLIFSDDTIFSENLNDIDVLFLCVAQGEAKKFLQENDIPGKIKVIDLSQDFRVTQSSQPKARSFIYGLPELNREQIQSANNIANPGCFATAIQLGLLPLAKAGLLNEVYTTGITGSTGAGQSLTESSHFSWRANNIQPYKTLTHQHLEEVHQSLRQLQQDFPNFPLGERGINFIPWRGDFTRGIFISSQIDCDWKLEQLVKLYEDFYAEHPFTIVNQETIFLKQVINTNKCVIKLEKVGSKLVIHSAIDNLLKGASGQAVQNMNLLFGIDECAGLRLKASYF